MHVTAVRSAIPGYDDHAQQYGRLVASNDLMLKMADPTKENVAASFVADRLGVDSIAFTHSTLELCERLWQSDCTEHQRFLQAHGSLNLEIHEMLRHVVMSVAQSIDPRTITQHFHISAAMAPSGMFRVRDTLVASGIPVRTPSAIIPEGCSGVLTAIELAEKLLSDKEHCLITAESDMSMYSHQRVSQDLSKDNIDNWLWGALFGEGVGAMLVTPAPHPGSASRLTNFRTEVVEDDWRVCLSPTKAGRVRMTVKAKAVKRTYLEHVTRNATEAIEHAGGVGVVSHLCLHESNPKLVARVAASIGVAKENVVSVCQSTGSLAGVSIFSLLDRAINSQASHKVACAVIGEAGGVIRAGRFLATGTG